MHNSRKARAGGGRQALPVIRPVAACRGAGNQPACAAAHPTDVRKSRSIQPRAHQRGIGPINRVALGKRALSEDTRCLTKKTAAPARTAPPDCGPTDRRNASSVTTPNTPARSASTHHRCRGGPDHPRWRGGWHVPIANGRRGVIRLLKNNQPKPRLSFPYKPGCC